MSTAAPKSREFPSRRTPGRVAAVHACDGAVRVVVTDVGESGLRVQAARSFEALAAAVQFVGEQGPERVVRVVPGGEAICRTTGIPRGTDSEMLAAARTPDFESVFIDGDDALEDRYGLRVPVLRDDASGDELDWPFDAAKLRAFLPAR